MMRKIFPLKKRAQILAKQMTEYADEIEKDITAKHHFDATLWDYQWESRFVPRIHLMINQLDEVGQHSPALDNLSENLLMIQQTGNTIVSQYIRQWANEINKLAAGLPESASP
jgi:hypothetical protein